MRWYWIVLLVVVVLVPVGYGIHIVTQPVVATIGTPAAQSAPSSKSPFATPIAVLPPQSSDAERLDEARQVAAANQHRADEAAALQARNAVRRRVYGSAWLSRNNGSSDLMRGLHVDLLPTVLPQAVAAASLTGVADEWGNWIKMSNDELNDELQKDAEDKRSQYPTQVYANAAVTTRKELKEYQNGQRAAQQAAAAVSRVGQDCSANFDQAKSLSHFAPFSFGQAVRPVAIGTAVTDSDGKFFIDPQPVGHYYLHAKLDTPTIFVEWVVPVTIGPDSDTKVDLYNENSLVLTKG